jgi:hypothetical protein
MAVIGERAVAPKPSAADAEQQATEEIDVATSPWPPTAGLAASDLLDPRPEGI